MTPQQMTRSLHERIPITAAMGLEVSMLTPHRVSIRAPLAPNVNPYGLGFGGSLSTVSLLSGWVLLQVNLARADTTSRLLVHKTEAEFIAPVRGDFVAVCSAEPAALREFMETLGKRGKSRIRLKSVILSNEAEVAHLAATFVAQSE